MIRLRYALLLLFCCVACLTCPKDDTQAWENISQNSGNSFTPAVAVDDYDNVYVVWTDSTPGTAEIFFAEKTSTGSWSEGINISRGPYVDVSPFIDVDNLGNVHVCWWEIQNDKPDAKIKYRMRDAAGNWRDIEILAQTATSDSEYALPRIVTDVNDNVFVDWLATADLRYVYKTPGGPWSDMMTIPNSVAVNPARLAADKSGNLHIAWDGSDQINYQMRTPDGTWQDYAIIIEGNSQPIVPDITVDGSGIVYITWAARDANHLYYFYYAHNASGDWSAPIRLPRVSDDDTGMLNSVAASDDGTIHFIWSNLTKNAEGSYEPSEIYYVYKLPDDTWSNVHNVSNTQGRSLCEVSGIAVDNSDNVHMVWADDEPGNFEVFYIKIPNDSLQ